MKVHVRSVEHLEGLIDKLTPCGTTSTSIVLSSPVERREIPKPEEAGTTLTMPQRKINA
jgi:hypothetical protein